MGVPNLQMFREDTPSVEVGTLLSPIDFGSCMGGVATALPYDILLYNDKIGALDSVPARSIGLELVRLDLSETFTSDGTLSQTYNIAVVPIFSYTITVNGTPWTRVDSLASYGQYALVYTLNLTTGALIFGDGIHGKIPPNSEVIECTYAPDTDAYGKSVVLDNWISFKSSGIVETALSVSTELATKITNTSLQVALVPKIVSIAGVWDNISKTGTNYYTGGSFNSLTGVITLGVALTGSTPYVDYVYQVEDDAETEYTSFVAGELYELENPLPKMNAKKLSFKATLPAAVDTRGGINLRMYLRLSYIY